MNTVEERLRLSLHGETPRLEFLRPGLDTEVPSHRWTAIPVIEDLALLAELAHCAG